MQVTEPGMGYHEYYDSGKVSENWIYASTGGESESLIWPKELKFGFDSWFINLEHSMGKLKGGERRITQPVYLAISTFKNWSETRRFALKSNDVGDTCLVEDYEIDVNIKNPFVAESFDINIIENRNLSHNGEIIVKSSNNFFEVVHVDLQGNVKNISIPIHTEKGFENDLISIQSNFSLLSFERKVPVFYIKNMEFKSEVTEDMGLTVYSISNGVMNIKASPEFSTGIFSLQFMGRDWLDNSFPKAGPRSWYNPWFGGIQNLPEELVENGRSLLKEHIEVEFVEKVDTLGNRWKGIKTSICMAHNEDYKGLEVNQYFLMLPGVPVILNGTELINNSDKYMNRNRIMNFAFFKIGEEIRNSWVSVKNYKGEITKYRPGVRVYEINNNSSCLYGADGLEYKIQVITDFNDCAPLAYLSIKDFLCMNARKISLASDQKKFLPNVFYTFTKEHISDKLLKNLHNVRFE